MELKIKNMVCPRCIMAVTETLDKLGLTPDSVSLGKVHVKEVLDKEKLSELDNALRAIGFELIHDEQTELVDRIKQAIIDTVRAEKPSTLPVSVILKRMLGIEFSVLSRTFAAVEGRTIEKYYLLQRVERVKELIDYNELSIKEIAYQSGFSSIAHLSRQFKQLTGLTPTEYKGSVEEEREGVDKV